MNCVFFHGLLGENRDIYFPKLSEKLHLIKFSDIAIRYLEGLGYTPVECESEDEARDRINEFILRKNGHVIFSKVIPQEKKILKNFLQIKKLLIWKDLKL